MALSVREALARVVDIFGPSASWDPTKLYGNLMVSPNGNILVGTVTDDNTNKLQVTGPVKITGAFATTTRPTFNNNVAWDAGNFNPANYAALNGATFSGQVFCTSTGSGNGVYRTTGDIGIAYVSWNTGTSTAAYQVDAATPSSGYMGLRWTHWGVRHIAAISGFEGGSTSSTCQINFLFGSTSPGHTFYDGGSATFSGALTQNSDYRIKTNLEAMRPAEILARVMKLQPKEYDRHEHEHHLHGRQAGFIAHEVQEQFPLLVKGEKDAVKTVKRMVGDLTPHRPGEEPEDYVPPVEEEVEVPDLQSVNYIGMVPYLTAALQAVNETVEAQGRQLQKQDRIIREQADIIAIMKEKLGL